MTKLLRIAAGKDAFVLEKICALLPGEWKIVTTPEALPAQGEPCLVIVDDTVAADFEEKLKGAAVVWLGKTVPKPFRIDGLQAAVEQAEKALSNVILLGNMMFYAREQLLVVKGERTPLTEKESALLAYLYVHPEGATREAICKEVWSMQAELDTHTLETHAYRLRGKLKEAGSNASIQAENGKYKITFEA